ncbi:MAG: acetyl-CoA carboxylase biotin carboxylase subunit [Syntrophales bacterium]
MKRKIQKVLIANRGEVALSIIKTAKSMGLKTVAVYEKPDSEAYFIHLADAAVMIGNGPVVDYLNIEKIIRIALESGADAIHPGYGFLAESADFAEACERAGLIFIGPPSQVIRQLGDKIIAKRMALQAGIPIVPGTGVLPRGEDGIREIEAFADKQGYPILLKAVAGGGGRGIRKIKSIDEIEEQLNRTRNEAKVSFNNDAVYAENFVVSPRHIEIQILSDTRGNVIHLGSRDCSIQRRNQKLIEVSPADVPQVTLDKMYEMAIRITRQSGYVNAGTVEFLFDPHTNEYWFMEVNARLQVEYTVTEMVTGVDIIRKQIEIAEGNGINLSQEDIHVNGCAIQVRINAEDPQKHFRPAGGKKIEVYQPPEGPGIRVDGMIYAGYTIPVAYDSMLAKLTVWGSDWKESIERLTRALGNFIIKGPETTIALYKAVCEETDFCREVFDTSYLDTHPIVFVSGI